MPDKKPDKSSHSFEPITLDSRALALAVRVYGVALIWMLVEMWPLREALFRGMNYGELEPPLLFSLLYSQTGLVVGSGLMVLCGLMLLAGKAVRVALILGAYFTLCVAYLCSGCVTAGYFMFMLTALCLSLLSVPENAKKSVGKKSAHFQFRGLVVLLLFIQCGFYWFGPFFSKIQDIAWVRGEGLRNYFSYLCWSHPLGTRFGTNTPGFIMIVSCYMTLTIQATSYLAIFARWGQPWFRRVWVFAVLLLHTSIGFTLTVGWVFTLAVIGVAFLFLDKELLDWLWKKAPILTRLNLTPSSFDSLGFSHSTQIGAGPSKWKSSGLRLMRFGRGVIVWFLLVVFVMDVSNSVIQKFYRGFQMPLVAYLWQKMRIYHSWGMFSQPYVEHYGDLPCGTRLVLVETPEGMLDPLTGKKPDYGQMIFYPHRPVIINKLLHEFIYPNNHVGLSIWAQSLIPWYRDQHHALTGKFPRKLEITEVTGVFAKPTLWSTIAESNPDMPMKFKALYMVYLDEKGEVERIEVPRKVEPALLKFSFPEAKIIQ